MNRNTIWYYITEMPSFLGWNSTAMLPYRLVKQSSVPYWKCRGNNLREARFNCFSWNLVGTLMLLFFILIESVLGALMITASKVPPKAMPGHWFSIYPKGRTPPTESPSTLPAAPGCSLEISQASTSPTWPCLASLATNHVHESKGLTL